VISGKTTKMKLLPKAKKEKQNTIIRAVKIMRIINIALIVSFLIYLYFWIKKH